MLLIAALRPEAVIMPPRRQEGMNVPGFCALAAGTRKASNGKSKSNFFRLIFDSSFFQSSVGPFCGSFRDADGRGQPRPRQRRPGRRAGGIPEFGWTLAPSSAALSVAAYPDTLGPARFLLSTDLGRLWTAVLLGRTHSVKANVKTVLPGAVVFHFLLLMSPKSSSSAYTSICPV